MSREDEGRARAERMIREDRWTPAHARRYLDSCKASRTTSGRDEYDRGFMSAIQDLASK